MISAGVDGRLAYMTYSDPWSRNPPKHQPPPPSPEVYFRTPRPKLLPAATRCIEEPSRLFLPFRSFNGLSTTTCPNGTRIAPPRACIKFPPSPPSALPVNLTYQVKDEKEPSLSPYFPFKGYPPVTPYPSTFPYPSICSQSYLLPSPQFPPTPLSLQDTFSPSTPTATFVSAKSTFSPPSATIVKPNQAIKDEKVSTKSPPSATITSSTGLQSFALPQSSSFKVPSGKEGSMKHRILTRPDETSIRNSSADFPKPIDGVRKRLASVRSPPRSPKRTLNNNSITTNFRRGQMIQLANGSYRKIEDMKTDDFIQSAKTSCKLKLCESTVVKIDEPRDGHVTITLSYNSRTAQIQMESGVDHPYFVYGQGWASYNPEKTQQSYGLQVEKLRVGDVLISLTPRNTVETTATPSGGVTRGSTTIITTATTTSMSTRQYTVNSTNSTFNPTIISSNRSSASSQALCLPPPSSFPPPHPKSSPKSFSSSNGSSGCGGSGSSTSSSNSTGNTTEFLIPSTQPLLLPPNYYHNQSPAETITSAAAINNNNNHHHPHPPPLQSVPLQLKVESKNRRWSAPDDGDDEKLAQRTYME